MFKDYSYLIRLWRKKKETTKQKMYIQTYNEHDSLTSRHKITLKQVDMSLKWINNQILLDIIYYQILQLWNSLTKNETATPMKPKIKLHK